MNKCGLNAQTINKIKSSVCREVMNSLSAKEDIQSLRQRVDALIEKEIIKNISVAEDYSVAAQTIRDALNRMRVDLTFFGEDALIAKLKEVKSGGSLDKKKISTEILYDTESSTRRSLSSKEFLDKAYGSALEVRNQAQRIWDSNILDSCFVNRGGIPGPIGVVSSTRALNNNIRTYQQMLLQDVVNYLKQVCNAETISQQELALLDNAIMYKNNQDIVEYTGILEQLELLIDRFLSPRHKTPSQLRNIYNRTLQDPNSNDAIFLKAFNANLLLKHFDTYMQIVLGKAIDIKDFGKKTGEDKYKIADKTNELISTWRTTDDVNVEEEIDNISKLFITTIPLYHWQHNDPIPNRFLNFQDFVHIIGKVKAIGMQVGLKNIIFDKDTTEKTYKKAWDSLSQNTQNILFGKSLYDVINQIRKNPRRNISAIFELLTNPTFSKIFESSFFNSKEWSYEEKQKLYSITKGLFYNNYGQEEDISLKGIVGKNPQIDYYGFISQITDTIFKKSFIQYYIDNNGNMKTRLLLDMSIYNIKSRFQQDITNKNGNTLIKDYDNTVYKDYNIIVSPTKSSITFTIPNTDYTITIGHNSQAVSKYKGKIFKNFKNVTDIDYRNPNRIEFFQDPNVINFLENILPIKLSADFLKTLRDTNGSDIEGPLLSLASRVLFYQYIDNKELDKSKTPTEVIKQLSTLFSEKAPKYNGSRKQLSLYSDIDTVIINNIAKTQAILKGLTTSSQVKDSSQASQSVQSLSMLLGSYPSQWSLIESKEDSASKNFMLLNLPGLFEGHYATSEVFQQGADGKKTTKFTISELAYSNFMLNFIPALANTSEDELISAGHAMFLASVNSDKNTIGQLKINLNTIIPMFNKALKDLDYDEYIELIRKEFGTFYSNILDNVRADYIKLTDFIARQYDFTLEGTPIKLQDDYLANFVDFSKWFYSQPDLVGRYSKPSNFLKAQVSEYNKYNRLNPLEFFDNIHYGSGGKNFCNPLIAQIIRFQPEYFSNLLKEHPDLPKDKIIKSIPIADYPNVYAFFEIKEREMVKSLLDSNFSVDLTRNSVENKYLKEKYPNWVEKSGKMILAKIDIDGETYSISSKTDLREIGIKTGLGSDMLQQKKGDKPYEYNYEVEIHPLLLQYNLLEYLTTQEWMNLTVGSFIDQKAKGDTVLEQEAGQFLAQHKRNVSMTAQKQSFMLNTLNGISEDYNIAVIEDIEISKPLLKQLNNKIVPFDGATFVNPFVVYLENNSLGGAKAGITKKQFVHFKNGRMGTGGIIKTAGFGLTNDWIRNSELLQIMMRRMTNHEWLSEDGQPLVLDITKNWQNDNIDYGDNYFKGIDGNYYKIEKIISLGNNQYRRIISQVTYDGTPIQGINSYVEQENKRIYNINSNYKLWQFFGGARAVELVDNKALLFSEKSIQNVVKAANNIGITRVNSNTGQKYQIADVETQEELWQPLKQVDIHYYVTNGAIKHGSANTNSSDFFYKKDDFKDIWESSAINDSRLNIQRIKMYESGIQLDKEHHANDSEVSLPTQIVSAAASLGYSVDDAHRMYEALRRATELGIKEQLGAAKAINDRFSDDKKNKLIEEVFKLVLDSIQNSSNSTSFAQIIAENIQKKLSANPNYKLATANLPISDRTIFRKVLSTVSSYLTNHAIKIKSPGILSVLCPSQDIFKLYADRKLESFDNPEIELAQLQAEQPPIVDVDLNYVEGQEFFKGLQLIYDDNSDKGITYKDGNTIIINSVAAKEVYTLINTEEVSYEKWMAQNLTKEYLRDIVIQNGSTQEYENKLEELAAKAINSHISDLELGRSYFITMEMDTIAYDEDGVEHTITVPQTIKEDLENPERLKELRRLVASGKITRIVENVVDGRNLGAYNVRFEATYNDTTDKFQLWELDSISTLHSLVFAGEANYNTWYQQRYKSAPTLSYTDFKKNVNNWLQNDLLALSKQVPETLSQFDSLLSKYQNGQATLKDLSKFVSLKLHRSVEVTEENLSQIRDNIVKISQVRINGRYYTINKDSIKTQAYEIIMPKTFMDEFGFTTFTDLKEVQEDKDYFIKQYIINNTTIAHNKFDVALKNSNGKHIYIINSTNLEGSELRPISGEIMTIEENGRIMRIDEKDNIMYEIFPGTEIYQDSQGNEVIVVKDTENKSAVDAINSYVSTISFGYIEFSNSLISKPSYLLELVQKLELNHRVGKYVSRKLSPEDTITEETVVQNLQKVNSEIVTLENYKELPEYNYIIQTGREKHTSFLKSLDIVAARIPAQSKQSYMPMKIIAYDNPNINTAHVSVLQILLQGSDFDIDSVTLVTYDIDKSGRIQTWSPYSNLSSIELLEESLKLPIPTGEETVIEGQDNYRNCVSLFVKYNKLFALDSIQSAIGQRAEAIRFRLRTIDTVEQFKLLREFLSTYKSFAKPNDNYLFLRALQEFGMIQIMPTDINKAVDDIYAELKSFVDEHNLYLDKLSNYDLTRVINNINTYSLYQSIADTASLAQAQESVDGPTEPIKRKANTSQAAVEAAKSRTPGNWVNKLESILENQEGKDCISICAVGLKGYFALSQYYNTVLNSGDSQKQARLKKSEHLERFLANAKALNPESIADEKVVKILVERGIEEDQAILLSALLGLSADNAKELSLAKLNAGSKMISIYIYGLSIGKDFNEIADLMMGRTGLLLKEVMDADIFNDKTGYFKTIDAIKYFTDGPKLRKFDIHLDPSGNYIQSPLQSFKKALSKNFGIKKLKDLKDLAKKRTLAEQLRIINELESSYSKVNGQYGYQKYLQLLDTVKEYLIKLNDINFDQLMQIDSLARGAEEMRILGAIAGLNQGIPSDLKSIINKISYIEEIFSEKADVFKELVVQELGSVYIDLESFAFNDEYRQKCIDLYDKVKHSFNILDCIASLPHLLGYVQSLATEKALMKRSYKFRNILEHYRTIQDKFNTDQDTAVLGLENYISDKMLSDWLDNINVEIPAGNNIFTKDGQLSKEPLTSNISINLKTQAAQQSFRLFMETEVIPNLRKGIIDNSSEIIAIKNNSFIRDLTSVLNSKTVSGDETIVYSLPINMLPRTEAEKILLNSYIDSFNQLGDYKYSYNLKTPVSIINLFTLYSMIAHNWTLSENSLVPILEKQQTDKLIESLHNFEAKLDKDDLSMISESEPFFYENIIPYIASKKGPYNSWSKYVWYKDKDLGRNILLQNILDHVYNLRKSGFEEEAENLLRRSINGRYFHYGMYGDLNYFNKGPIKDTTKYQEKNIKFNNRKATLYITLGEDSDKVDIKFINNQGQEEYITDVLQGERLPKKIINGISDFDISTIKDMIDRKLNDPCK